MSGPLLSSVRLEIEIGSVCAESAAGAGVPRCLEAMNTLSCSMDSGS